MIPQFTLSPLEAQTKGEVKRLRLSGSIPVSIQHKGMETQHYQQKTAPLQEFIRLHGDGVLLELITMPDERRQNVIVKAIQRDMLSLKITQVTFQLVRLEDTLKTHVPITFVGAPAQIYLHEAMVIHQLERLDVECSQIDLPEQILVDVSQLVPGGVLRVSDIPENARYKIVTSQDTVLASLTRMRGAGTAEAAEVVATPETA